MKMSPLTIVILVVSVIVGMYLGLQFPVVSMLLLIPLAVFVVVVLLRNKSGALADAAATAKALQMQPPAAKALVYFMRKGFVAGQQGLNIMVDGGLNSQIRSGYFLMAELDPGEHTITAQFSSGTKGSAVSHSVTLAEGEVLLFDMKLNMGLLQGKPIFTEIRDLGTAKSKLTGLKMVLWK